MTYQSPYTTRYGSAEMRAIWSETSKRRVWRRVWVAVAEAQAAAGLVSPDQLDDVRSHADEVDIARSLEIEAEIGHDLMAELKTFAEQSPEGGAILHWGLTSADVQDNAEVVRQKAALKILIEVLRRVLLQLADLIDTHADRSVMGFTHLQPAEPTTLGYRLSLYAQDFYEHAENLIRIRLSLRGKGIRGAVGTSGPFVDMLEGSEVTPEMLEATVMHQLGIEPFSISSQTYPRIQDFRLLSALAGMAGSFHKFALDLRLMQSPGFPAIREPFGDEQVGSSAMPFKRNPIKAEKICSLARSVFASQSPVWENAAQAGLERTLDDSANRRGVIPEAFLACDEILHTASLILDDLTIDEQGIAEQLDRYGPFAAMERVLTALVMEGADRQQMHEQLRQHSLKAWSALQQGQVNPLRDQLAQDPAILKYLQPGRIRDLLEARSYVGTAPQRARAMAERIRARYTTSEEQDQDENAPQA
ncbi:MAG: adenylosuccinate lyase [Anaerolineales bacterium]